MGQDRLQILHDRLMVQYARRGIIYASEDHLIFASSDRGATWNKVCALENRHTSLVGQAKNVILRSGIVRRFRRNIGMHNVVVLPSGTILIQYDGIYRFDGTGTDARLVYRFTDENLYGPLKNGFVVDDSSGNVYFGEYNNQRPYSVRIVRGTDDGRTWQVCHRFPSGEIKHVHGIVPDPYRRRLWVCTGDNDQESNLFYTDDDFGSLQRFNGGSQTWRMVSLIPTEDALIWGSDAGRDAPAADNHIYRWSFAKNRIEQLQYINKPAYYSTRLRDGSLVLGTTLEPGQQGIGEHTADIWVSRNGEQWDRAAALPFSPSGRATTTRYGTINLPLGDGSLDTIYFTPVNVRELDFHLLACHRAGDAGTQRSRP